MQEAALVFTTSSKLHKEIETAGRKTMSIVFKGDTLFPRFPTPQATYLESNYSKIYVKQRQTGNTTSNRISFRVP